MIDDGVTDIAATFNNVSSAPTGAITDLISLRDALRNFCTERDWHQYHTPKNLVMALSVEAAELVEHFQWATAEESANLTDEKRAAVADEIADVLVYLTELADVLGVDMLAAVRQKINKNAQKYPVPNETQTRTKITS